MTTTLRYSIHRQLINKDNPAKAAFGWERIEGSGEDLFQTVTQNGIPFTSLFKENHRKDSNWEGTSILALDFDGTVTDQLSYQDVIKEPFIQKHALFVYPSPSYEDDAQKYRIVFATDIPITEPSRFKGLTLALMKRTKGADIQCKDLARFFWGCNIKKNVEPIYLGNILNEAIISSLIGAETQPDQPDVVQPADRYYNFFNGKMKEGMGRNSTVYDLSKDLGKTSMTLESASALMVSMNNKQENPLTQDELTKAFTNGWNKIRNDHAEDIDIVFEDAFTARHKTIQPMEVLVEGFMHKTGLYMIAGSPGVGKSLLAMNMALSIAAGKDQFLHYPIKTNGMVLWIDYEMTDQEFIARLKKIPIIPPEGMFKYQLDAPDITDSRFLSKLEELIEKEKPVLLVVDNITTSHGGDENAAKDVRKILRPLQNLSRSHSISILLVHHFKKHVKHEVLNLDMVVGSGTFGRLVHSALLMRDSAKDTGMRILKADKLRNWAHTWKNVYGVKLQGDLSFEYTGEVDELEHLPQQFIETKGQIDWDKFISVGEEVSREELLTRIRSTGIQASQPTLARWLQKAVDSGEISKPRHGIYQRGDLSRLKELIQDTIGAKKTGEGG